MRPDNNYVRQAVQDQSKLDKAESRYFVDVFFYFKIRQGHGMFMVDQLPI